MKCICGKYHCSECGHCNCPEWIRVKDHPAPKDKPFLGYVKLGLYFGGGKDDRLCDIQTCIWDAFNETFSEACNCSGYEVDSEDIEIISWMPLPEPPKE